MSKSRAKTRSMAIVKKETPPHVIEAIRDHITTVRFTELPTLVQISALPDSVKIIETDLPLGSAFYLGLKEGVEVKLLNSKTGRYEPITLGVKRKAQTELLNPVAKKVKTAAQKASIPVAQKTDLFESICEKDMSAAVEAYQRIEQLEEKVRRLEEINRILTTQNNVLQSQVTRFNLFSQQRMMPTFSYPSSSFLSPATPAPGPFIFGQDRK